MARRLMQSTAHGRLSLEFNQNFKGTESQKDLLGTPPPLSFSVLGCGSSPFRCLHAQFLASQDRILLQRCNKNPALETLFPYLPLRDRRHVSSRKEHLSKEYLHPWSFPSAQRLEITAKIGGHRRSSTRCVAISAFPDVIALLGLSRPWTPLPSFGHNITSCCLHSVSHLEASIRSKRNAVIGCSVTTGFRMHGVDRLQVGSRPDEGSV